MRRFLLATAAAAALALAAPIAAAQYTDPTPSDPAATTARFDTASPQAPSATAPPPVDSATSAAAPTQAYSTSGTTSSTAQTYGAAAGTSGQTGAAGAPSSPYGQTAAAGSRGAYTRGGDTMMQADVVRYAQEAGMAGVPMSAAEVCAPRDVSLGSRSLTHDARQKLRFAADRASVCEVQRVVINAPSGRAAAVRQTLVDHGFDESKIEVQDGSELGLEMTFVGVATSSDQYAAIFSPQQLASYQPSGATSYGARTNTGAASSYAPAASGMGTTSPNARSMDVGGTANDTGATPDGMTDEAPPPSTAPAAPTTPPRNY